jgi:transposase
LFGGIKINQYFCGMEKILEKLRKIEPILNEKQRRIVFAAEAEQIGRGGKSKISALTGISRSTLDAGFVDLKSLSDNNLNIDKANIRRPGGGRKKITETEPQLLSTLESLVDPVTRVDPESALRWTIKSTRTLAKELTERGFKVGKSALAIMLDQLGYSLQSNQKRLEGANHPDRNAQFEHINNKAQDFINQGFPVISVDTKKKENIGNYKNNGQEYRKQKCPRAVEGHDFAKQKATPYGIYDIKANSGFINVGTNCDTSSFAVNSIKFWWEKEGKNRYPSASKMLITADAGGSNGYNRKLWKYELQQFANEYKIEIFVCHFPPGTSKWNKIEHRLFSFISINWKGQPLTDYETVVNLISATKTATGLTVTSQLNRQVYRKGIQITEEQMNKLNITKNTFHGEWNYSINEQKCIS